MGIEYEDMRSILRATSDQERRRRLLVLGNAVVHFTGRQLRKLAAEEGVTIRELPDALVPEEIGRALAFERTDTMDINGKTSIHWDLHKPVPEELRGQFDTVIDAGVLFWCFDPAAALANVFRLAAPQATLIHISALSGHYGRGLLNLHPRFFESFYEANQARFLGFSARAKYRPVGWLGRLSHLLRFRNRTVWTQEPHQYYLDRAGLLRMSFRPDLRFDREPNIVPNNCLGVFCFRKTTGAEPVYPVLTPD
jgi:hypothetical protein